MEGNTCVQSSRTWTLQTVLISKLSHPLYCIYSCMRQEAHLMLWTKSLWISVASPMIEVVYVGSCRSGAFQ